MSDEPAIRVSGLDNHQYQALLQGSSRAPLMQAYIKLLRQAGSKRITTAEWVKQLYPKANRANYSLYENRFYKLRKRLLDTINNAGAAPPATELTDEEQQRDTCRSLLAAGKFAEAEKQLAQLEKLCVERNIFELLPEVYDQLILAKHSLNKLSDTAPLFTKYQNALVLYAHINQAKILARRIYEINVNEGIQAAGACLKQMDRLARQHKCYPRFKLVYNFVAGYYKVGSGSRNSVRANVTARHIKAARRILLNHPYMPVVNYVPGYRHSQLYRLRELEAIVLFRAYRYTEAAATLQQLLNDVTAAGSAAGRMLNEVLIVNTIHMHIAAQNGAQAMENVQLYFNFLRRNKYHKRVLRAYCEMANVVGTLGVKPPGTTYETLLKNVEQYRKETARAGANSLHAAVCFLQAKLLLRMNRTEQAKALFETKEVEQHIDSPELHRLIIDILSTGTTTAQQLSTWGRKLKSLKHRSVRTDEQSVFNWVEMLLRHKAAK